MFKDESWKTEILVDQLNEMGYRVNWSDLQEPVIDFLMEGSHSTDPDYLALRYKIDPLIAKSMIRDMIKIKREQIDPKNDHYLSTKQLNHLTEINERR